MAIKWINTNRKNPPAEGPQRPPRERGWLSAAAGLLAFVLGLSMVIDGCVFIAGAADNRNNWLADSLESDYQNTSQFRTFIADRLESMIVMGLGGPGGDCTATTTTTETLRSRPMSSRIPPPTGA